MNPNDTCEHCRFWQSETCLCRLWPDYIARAASDSCGQFKASASASGRHFGRGNGKANDDAIIAKVREACTPFEINGVMHTHFVGVLRSELVKDLMTDFGITSTPAHNRIQRLVNAGIFQQGACPNTDSTGERMKGIWIWMDVAKQTARAVEAAVEPSEAKGGEFEIWLRTLAGDESQAKSLRAIHRGIVAAGLKLSLATCSRRMDDAIASGIAAKGESGYYALPGKQSAAPTAAPESLDAD